MCDIWRSSETHQISWQLLQDLLAAFQTLEVRWVVLSGGEPLLYSNLFELAELLKQREIRVSILSTGQRLEELSEKVAIHTSDTILSLDGPENVHDRIRCLKGAFLRLTRGIQRVREYRADYPFSCRTTVQRDNFRHLRATVEAARVAGFNSISFLPADVHSTAFNRPQPWQANRQRKITGFKEEIEILQQEIEQLITEYALEIESGFIRENPEKLRRIVQQFRVHIGEALPVSPRCNAPWTSAVIEADGTVRPCFFHQSLGNIHTQSFINIVNGTAARLFRASLDIPTNPTCQQCVCSLYVKGSEFSSAPIA